MCIIRDWTESAWWLFEPLREFRDGWILSNVEASLFPHLRCEESTTTNKALHVPMEAPKCSRTTSSSSFCPSRRGRTEMAWSEM